MYRLNVPQYAHESVIQFHWWHQLYDSWIGLPNYNRNAWEWVCARDPRPGSDLNSVRYDPDSHISDGQLVLVVVAMYDSELEWLIAGDTTPPLISTTQPKLIMTGDTVQLSAIPEHSLATAFEWDFGAGLSPQYSGESQPVVTGGAPGSYEAMLTTQNQAGSNTYEFTYTVTEQSEYPPQHLLAIPSKTELNVDEEVTVTLVSGDFPDEEPLWSCVIYLLVPDCADYVSGSYNVGAPGGAATDCDGIWASMSPTPTGFIPPIDEFIRPEDSGIPGLVKLELDVVPLGGCSGTIGGELFNIKLRFSEPGTFDLGIKQGDGYKPTYYMAPSAYMYNWYDVSNNAAPSIVVSP